MATEVETQLAEHPLMSPRAELKPEKKSEHRPRSHGDGRPQKELMIPGIVDFQLIQTAPKTPKPQTPGAYHFGRLSHHSFFSRHHPHPQRVTHIRDLTGKPVCVVRDEFSPAPLPQATLLSRCLMGMPTISVPIGDPQSNREPRLSSEAWKKELKDLTSQVAIFTKENELKSKEILELLCQILQTDSLSAIQFWLLYAPPKEKDLALGLLQTAVAQLLPQPLDSIPVEKLLDQLQEVQEPSQERQQPSYSQSPKKTKPPPLPKGDKPEYVGRAQVLRMHSSQNAEERTSKPKAEC
uniref:Protein TBATA isoform X2 n=1 Tax=Callorhinus ursinus TaxID=34884 RepID=A0A3Q7MGQ7_CALUR|nr:protein TBATA isoform X2 [Callorhinus ursinus]